MNSYEMLIKECDALIRSGRAVAAAARLQRINSVKVPRNYRVQLAALARRAGLLALGLRMLGGVVYPKREREGSRASPRELAEYAVLLTRAGAYKEALKILAAVDPKLAPEALLFLGFAHFAQWDHAAAVPSLEKYLATELTDYQALVGRVNLAYAYIGARQFVRARETLGKNIEIARASGHAIVESNCFELLTRLEIEQQNFSAARIAIGEAMRAAGQDSPKEHRLAEKWLAILDGIESQSVEPLRELKRKIDPGDHENLREIDRYSLKIQFDQTQFDRLIFGTPFKSFRENLCRELGRQASSESFVRGESSGLLFSARTGRLSLPGSPDWAGEQLESGGKIHHLIEILNRDFYRPLKLGEIFAELFEGERFDVDSSPNRVHQVVFRTRDWLKASSLAVEISEQGGYYSLTLGPGVGIEVPLERAPIHGLHQQLLALKDHYLPGELFVSREAREKLSLPRTCFFRFTKWAMSEGLLERVGANNLSQYRLIDAGARAAQQATAAPVKVAA